MSVVAGATRDLNLHSLSSARFSPAIAQVVQHATSVLNAEMAAVLVYDSEAEELVLQLPAFGLNDEWLVNRYRIRLNSSKSDDVAACVFRTGKTVLLSQCANPKYKDLLSTIGIRDLLTAPLEVGEHRLGVLHVANKKGGTFSPEDVRAIGLVAGFFGLLIQNMCFLEQQREHLARLETLQAEMRARNQEIEQVLEFSRLLTSRVLEDAGVEVLASELSRFLGGRPVEVLDALGRIRARCGEESLPLENEEWLERWLVVGKRMVGKLRVRGRENELAPLQRACIDQAVSSVALQVLCEATRLEVEGKVRGHVVAQLIRGKDLSEVEQSLRRLGLEPSQPRVVTVVKSTEQDRYLRDRMTFLQRMHPDILMDADGPHIIFIVPLPTEAGGGNQGLKRHLRRQVAGLVAEILNTDRIAKPAVGVGTCCRDLSEYKVSHQRAMLALRVAEGVVRCAPEADPDNGGPTIFFWDECGALAVLSLTVGNPVVTDYVREVLGPLLELRGGQELLLTLEVYLKNRGRFRATAAELHIHPSTLRYRLERIEAALGLVSGDSSRWFEIQLALHLWHLMGEAGKA